MSEDKEINQVYEDRNVLAIAFVKSKTMLDPASGGWTPAPDSDSDEWAIVWFETVMGEVSWHVPRDIAEKHLPRNDDRDYDGYSRERKNERVWELIDGELLHE